MPYLSMCIYSIPTCITVIFIIILHHSLDLSKYDILLIWYHTHMIEEVFPFFLDQSVSEQKENKRSFILGHLAILYLPLCTGQLRYYQMTRTTKNKSTI